MQVGDLVRVEGGTLRPAWYGKTGVIISSRGERCYHDTGWAWYMVAFPIFGTRMIRDDMLVVISESW